MVQHIEQAAAKGEWPQVDERFIRPGAIVSIDVQRPDISPSEGDGRGPVSAIH